MQHPDQNVGRDALREASINRKVVMKHAGVDIGRGKSKTENVVGC